VYKHFNQKLKQKYKMYRNILKILIENAKSDYLMENMLRLGLDTSMKWKIIHSV